MTTTNMEEVPLSPKLKGSLKSPSLRVRSPSAKSNIAISRGDDDSSVDDDRINNKMCVSDGSTITCVFNKKRLFGGSALAFVAVVVIMAVAIATSSSSSANHMDKVASVGGNSNAVVDTTNVGSAAPPKVAPIAPKVAPVAPAKSNFAFVTPNSVGGGYSGKSGKSGRNSCSSSDFNRSFNPLSSSWSGSGKSGKSGSNTCSFGSSGKSGKSGSRNFICDGWHGSSGKSGKSNSRSKPSTPEIFQKTGAGCFAATPRQANAGTLSLGQEVCGQLAFYSVEGGECPINRFGLENVYDGENCHVYDSYLLRVECAGDYSFFLTSKQQRFVVPTGGTVPLLRANPYITKVPELAFSTSHSGKSGKSGGFLPNFTCPDVGSGYAIIGLPEPANLFISPSTPTAVEGELVAFWVTLQPGLYEINVGSPYGIQTTATNNLLPTCNDDNEAFDYTLKVVTGTVVGNQ